MCFSGGKVRTSFCRIDVGSFKTNCGAMRNSIVRTADVKRFFTTYFPLVKNLYYVVVKYTSTRIWTPEKSLARSPKFPQSRDLLDGIATTINVVRSARYTYVPVFVDKNALHQRRGGAWSPSVLRERLAQAREDPRSPTPQPRRVHRRGSPRPTQPLGRTSYTRYTE